MPEQPKGPESRRTPRRAYVRPIGVLRAGQFDLYQGLQLSEGGLLFGSSVKMAPKEFVLISLVMPGQNSLVAKAEILYEKPGEKGTFQYGVKFVSLQINQRRSIRNYVTAKTEQEAEAELEMKDETSMEKWRQAGKKPRVDS